MSLSSYPCHRCKVYFSSEDASVYHHRHSHPSEPDPIKLDQSHPPLTETSHRDAREYVCDVCHEAFTLQSLLTNHQKLSHPEPLIHECNVCHKLFSSQTDLIKHKVGPCCKGNKVECDMCQKVFLRPPDLITHKQKWHNERIKYECDVCHREFISQSRLLGHQRFYKGRKVHEYKVQDKEFMKRYFMTKHYNSSKHRVWKRLSS
ncbi:zinc finger protein 677-like [Trichogramma pretiosum]|uniref:zinc finger protein 677-like n=1 Tax=Trichogramma pretiosum TaxID=7493 RepID=UPI0006C9C20F|nr:zinc finger protein 677-like [Trichogramma pretiosum]